MDEQTTSKGRARTEVPDTQVSGLWVRIAPSGIKTYAIRYRLHGRSARYTIGRTTNVTLKHARKHALELFDDIRRGNDPRHRKSDDVTLNKHVFIDLLVDLYVPSLRDRKRGRNLSERHISEIERRLMSSVVPRLKGRPFLTIDAHAIETVLQDIEKTAPRVAAHVYYDLKGLYAWATKRGLADTSPMIGIEPPAKPESRDRVLSATELGHILCKCAERPTVYNTIIQLLLLTAQRRGEVTNAAWLEFDLDDAVWTIPKQRTKNRREHRVPLSSAALNLLSEWKRSRLTDNYYLFPTRGSDRACFTGFSRSKKRLDQLSGVSGWTVHDLRRTVATKMAESGAQPHVIERILNHASGTMTPIARVYNRASYEAEMRDALEKWANHVTSLTSPTYRPLEQTNLQAASAKRPSP